MKNWNSYEDVKICVYAICADEPKEFIDRWLNSMKRADYITVLITKANNSNTKYFLEKQELEEFKNKLIIKEQEIKPWRFDIARNESMKLIPEGVDACICTDIDEVLIEDFWDDYRKIIFEHPNFDKVFYKYAWAVNDDGIPSTVFWYDKTHQPNMYHWEYPVHETLTKNEDARCRGNYYLNENKIYLKHLPEQVKDSRNNYLNLLELRVKEYPEDLRGFYYLAREYSFVNDYNKALAVNTYLYTKFSYTDEDELMLPCICNMMGLCYSKLGYSEEADFYFKKAISLKPELRDPYVNLAQKWAYENRPNQCIELIDEMFQKTKYIEDWRVDFTCWRNWRIYQILGDAHMWLGQYLRAREYFSVAVEDIVTGKDRYDAFSNGFENDLKFLNSKLEEIEKKN